MLPRPRCCTSPAHATRRPSPRSCAPGSTAHSPWYGSRATRPGGAGGRRTASPDSTRPPTTRTPRPAGTWAASPWDAGKPSSAARPAPETSTPGAANSWTRTAWYGNPEKKPGRPNWPSSAPTTTHTDTSPHGRTPTGATPKPTPGQSAGRSPTSAEKNGLGKNPERAATRAAQLTALDPDWNCPWPLDWQRHYRVLAQLAEDEPGNRLPGIAPGVLFEGNDLGRWLQQQAHNWTDLSAEQQQRLTTLGVTPAERPGPAAKNDGKPEGKLPAAFQRSVTALAQYISREGHHRVPRSHVEENPADGHHTPVPVRLGVFMSNTKTRRDKLTGPQRAALAELGIERT